MKNVALVLAGIVLGGAATAALTGRVFAQGSHGASHKWQQFCEPAATIPEASSIAGARGVEGWELVSYAGGAMCFKRPMPQPRGDNSPLGY
jgi:hypothetical protein